MPARRPSTRTAEPPAAFVVLNEIGIVSQLAGNRFERRLAPLDLNLAQFTVLNHFARLPGTRTLVELARAFQLSKGAMTNTAQRLSAKGLIEVAEDPHDGRSKRVGVTPAGLAARDRAIAALDPDIAAIERAIGQARLAAMVPELQALRRWLDEQRDTT